MSESTPSSPNTAANSQRRRGRKPADADTRRAAVERAITELTEARVPFSMGDVAERAGISRATLYRDAGLRDLVGTTGDSPVARPVNNRDYEKLQEKAKEQAKELRSLRRELRDTAVRLEDALEAARTATKRAPTQDPDALDKLRKEAYADGFAAGTRAAGGRGSGPRAGGGGDLTSVAARLPRQSLVNARRKLATALHPDLYAQDPAAALLATEILKQLNVLVGPGR